MMSSSLQFGVANGSRVFMAKKGTKKVAKKPAGTKKASGGAKSSDTLWMPGLTRPAWLDGSMAGDRGFDPLGLSKPVEFLQFEIDELDQNAAVNKKGNVTGAFSTTTDEVSTEALQPYSEVFGIQRFRECELIHGRWCMLATTGCLVQELVTGVPWQKAGEVILQDGGSYFGLGLPFSVTQLVWIEVLLVGGAELYRNSVLDTTARCYPGGYFDPLNFGSGDPAKVERLKEAEIKHGRLAMIAFLGFSVQALATGEGIFGSLSRAVNL
ncbi:hypothetical protein BSKO_00787 [Bryopsis sp. KO-2023]|nr:hypothetical protein BSKO_00787 [Bryopsis sp. KO-2023]